MATTAPASSHAGREPVFRYATSAGKNSREPYKRAAETVQRVFCSLRFSWHLVTGEASAGSLTPPLQSVYRDVLDEGAVVTLLALDDAEIARLIPVFEAMAEAPMTQADCSSLDRRGRSLHNRIIGDFLIGYWPEHATRTVHILRIGSPQESHRRRGPADRKSVV